MNNWHTRTLFDLVSDVRSGFACGHHLSNGVFQFRMNNVSRDGTMDLSRRRRVPRDTANLASYLVKEGDVLFNATNSPDLVGKSLHVGAIDEPAVFSNHFIRLRPDSDLADGRFLARWLNFQFQRRVFKHLSRQWVNQATVGRDALLGLSVQLPRSVNDQRRIADILDRAEELRVKRRATVALIEMLVQSTFLEMFGNPGRNPKGWSETELSAVVANGTIVTYGIVQAGDEYDGGVPYIRTGDIVDGEVVEAGLRRTAPEIAAKFGRSRVSVGDIVMSIRATVGTTAVVTAQLDGANLTQGTARISPGSNVHRSYLLSYLRSPAIQSWIQRQIKGATFREITLARLRQLPILLPPLSLQNAFAARAAAFEKLKVLQRASLARLDELFASLQDRAFRGEL